MPLASDREIAEQRRCTRVECRVRRMTPSDRHARSARDVPCGLARRYSSAAAVACRWLRRYESVRTGAKGFRAFDKVRPKNATVVGGLLGDLMQRGLYFSAARKLNAAYALKEYRSRHAVRQRRLHGLT